MLHICKMDYIKDLSRESKLEQLGPGVVKEYSPLNPRHLEKKNVLNPSDSAHFILQAPAPTVFNPLRTQHFLWFPPKPLNSMHPPLEIEIYCWAPLCRLPLPAAPLLSSWSGSSLVTISLSTAGCSHSALLFSTRSALQFFKTYNDEMR